MGFFDRFSNKASRFSVQNNNNPLQAFTQSLQRMWSKPPKRDNAELPDLAHKSPRLDPIFIIGRSIASTPWNIYNKLEYRQNGKTAKPILNSPLYDLLDMPMGRYPEIDWYSLCYSTIAVIKAVGGYYWLKVRDDKGQVVELDPIPPAWVPMQPTINNPYYTIYPIGVTAAKALIVSPDDIVRFKRPDLSDPYGNGRGDSEQLEDEFQIDEFSAKAEMNLLYNDATPPYIITAPGMPQDQAEAFKKSWMQKLGGYLHRREPGVLGFDAKIQTLAMSPVEMDLMESRKFIREEVYQHYQIPPEIYGNIENSNRATIQSAEYLFHKNVLNTEYRFMERVIDRQLVQVDFDRNLCFRFDDCVPEDEDFKLATLNAGLTSGVVQVDEWRKAFDLPELPNNKGKVFLRTFAQYEVPADGSDDTTEPTSPEPASTQGSQLTGETEDKPTEDPNMAQPEDDTSKAIIRIVSKSVADSLNCDDKTTIKIVSDSEDKPVKKDEARRIAIWKAFDAKATSKEGEFIQAVKKYSATQKKRVIDALDSSKLDSAIESKGDYGKAIEVALGEVFNDKANKALKSALAPAWLDTLEAGRDHAHDMIGTKPNKAASPKKPVVTPSLEVTNSLFNKYVEEIGLLKAEGINDTTNEKLRKKLQQTISDGITNGDTLNTIKNAILDVCDGVYSEMDSSRARTIARTESASSMTAGTFITGKSEGMTQKSWLSVQDERTRQDHSDIDGTVVGIDEPFHVGGCEMQYPLDPSCNDAGEIVNCRCSVLLGNDDIPLD